ncbi:MAG: CDP-diacylglycerol--glycerol-3-phosphate 3-phosphatidyltransferase [Coriobacteriales bacterium]|jgi:CDP-diacylglycerol--glycerol-3-phosphate 3-phosphatidyltransferase|nr:CDP-diacylglycerol--glycerol-3-phosphate 3-phosphatidyltransferase [Coriobacteriales bacterium]
MPEKDGQKKGAPPASAAPAEMPAPAAPADATPVSAAPVDATPAEMPAPAAPASAAKPLPETDGQEDWKALFTPANIVTVTRIVLIPAFVIALLAPWSDWSPDPVFARWIKPWVAAAIFAVLAATDALDGYLARSRNEVSNLGKFLDPLADKILVTAALLALIELDVLPAWVALVILAREFLVSGLRMVASAEGQVIAASHLGKAKTIFQIIAVILFIIKDASAITGLGLRIALAVDLFSWLVMSVALLLTLISLVDYFIKSSVFLGLPMPGDKGRGVLGSDTEAFLAREVCQLAWQTGRTVGLAESCTGGRIAAALTSIPGASEFFRGGIVSYDNAVKRGQLAVTEATLTRFGAVSEQCALEMAQGARAALGSDVALSVTGIAGPKGASPGKPVGTVWFGLASPAGCRAVLHTFAGDRDAVRRAASETALRLLSEELRRS